MRACVFCVALALMSGASAADESPRRQSYVDTKDLKLVYYDFLDYLVPYAVRTFTSSLAWQRRMFGWVPSEPTTVLLQDFSDIGNARQYSAPRNKLVFEVAPIPHAFETFPATERMYFLMNHETVHVVTGDMASEEDLRWRRFFLGKVWPLAQNPETLLYSYLTVPRFNTPRWWNEGAAVFLETWMNGGLGRAQGGYDEMVFRGMVRDSAYFYDPLGLASRAIRVNFQSGANAYLYGTRFFTYLAFVHSPEKVMAWIRRDEGSQRNYADQFQQVFGLPLEQAWQDWIAFEREFQRSNLEAVRKFPITPQKNLAAEPIGSISRMYYDDANATLYAAFRVPGVVDQVGALNTRDGSLRRLADVKGGALYRVASTAYDAASGTLFFTNDNQSFRDLMAVDVKTGEERMLIKGARIGEIAFNPVDRSLLGIRHWSGVATLVRIPYPYTQWVDVHTFPWEYVPSDLDISADGRLLSASVSEVNNDQYVRVWEIDKILAGDVKPLSEFRFGQSVPEGFVFSRDGRYLYGSSYYTGVSNIFRYEVASGAIEAVSNAETGFFRPVPLADGRLLVLSYTAEGFIPATIEPRPLQDVGAITFLGAEVAAKYPVVKTWQVPPAETVDYEKVVVGKGPYFPLKNLALDNAYPVLQGYKNYAGIGYHANIADPISDAYLGITAAYTPTGNLPANQRGHVDITGDLSGLAGEPVVESVGLLRSLRAHETQPQRLCRQAGLHRLADLRRAQDVQHHLRHRLVRQDRHAARCAERLDDVHPSVDRGDRDPLHGSAAIDRRGRRRERARLVAGGQRKPDAGSRHAADPRHARRRNSASDPPFLHLAAQRGGWRQRRSQQYPRQLLLRWIRQQLCRQQVCSALSRIQLAARIRDRPGERTQFRAGTGRMESPAHRLRIRRHARLPSDVAPAGDLRHRVVDRCRKLVPAAELPEHRGAGGPQIQCPPLVRHDAVGGLCGGIPEPQARGHRVDAFPQDHVAMARGRVRRREQSDETA